MNKTLFVLMALALFVVVSAQEKYPAGVSPAACPNYPFCNVNGYGAPAGYTFDRVNFQYPPGIHPSTCPNYPFC